MKISDRFTDYGLLGGFFWAIQLGIAGLFGFVTLGWAAQARALATLLNGLPSGAIAPVAGLLGAVGLICIFATGLVLDLVGTVMFRSLEMRVFRRYASNNEVWLRRFAERHKDFVRDDLLKILDLPPMWSKEAVVVSFLILFAPWKESYRRRYRASLGRPLSTLGPYTRMQALLLSYITLSSGPNTVELLSTQTSLWSSSRMLAVAMFAFSIELPLLAIFGLHWRSLAIIVQWAVTLLTLVIVYCAYDRVCNTIFALTYMTEQKAVITTSCQVLAASS